MTIAGAPARQDSSALIGLCLAGCALLALAVAAPWIVRALGYAVFIPALAASGLVTIVATRCAIHVPVRTGLIIVLGFALAMRLALVGIEPLLSTDLYRYIWDGRVQAAGINPYLYVPADPALAALRDAAIYPHINRADYAVTAYPPVAEMFFFVVSRIAETATMMRLAMVACEIVIVAVVIDLLRRLALPVTAVVAYAWHPLAVWEIANNGHVEALMVALMMLGVWLLVRAQRVARRDRGDARGAGEALCGADPSGLLAAVGLARAARDRRDDPRLLSALSRRRHRRVRLSRAGLSAGGRLRQRQQHLGSSRCCRPCSARCPGSRRSTRPPPPRS